MSAPSNATTTPPSTLTGIIATKPDFAPSIVFVIAFIALIPLAIWRGVSRTTRTVVLIRPAIFIQVRIATYIVRAIQANGTYTVAVIATELVLLTVGTVLLIEPLIELIKRLLEACIPYNGPMIRDRKGNLTRKDEVGLLSRVLKLALVAVVALSVYTATQIGDAFSDADTAHTVVTLRKAVAAVIIGILGLCVLALLYFHVRHTLPSRTVYILVTIALLLEITSAYRLASAMGDAGARKDVAFWLASAVPEWLAVVAFFAVNLNALIPPKLAAAPGSVPMAQATQPAYQYAHIQPVRDHV